MASVAPSLLKSEA
uniref:Putative LRR receptor-like serine/threonine-protein kinase At5g10290 n=1 Tax=Rhizophora mucronata TaxID=61149 RepID=A0A2P2KUT1_RHIMU